MNKRNLIYSGFSALFALCFSLGVACATWGQDVPSPPNPVVPTPSKPVPWVLLPQGQPLITPPVPSSMEWDGTNLWLTGSNGTRGTLFSGNTPSVFNTTVTFGSSGILDFSSGSVINFADGSVWKSTGLVFGTGTALSFPDGSAWGSGGLTFGTTGTETLPDGSTWKSTGLTFGTTGTETLPDGSTWKSTGLAFSTPPTGTTYKIHSVTFATVGTTQWTVPSDVYSILVEGAAGGGGAFGVAYNTSTAYISMPGSNGANTGGYEVFPVNPGDVLSVTVGGGGAGGSSGGAGANGGASTIVDTTTSTTLVNLPGGTGGTSEVDCATSGCMVVGWNSMCIAGSWCSLQASTGGIPQGSATSILYMTGSQFFTGAICENGNQQQYWGVGGGAGGSNLASSCPVPSMSGIQGFFSIKYVSQH